MGIQASAVRPRLVLAALAACLAWPGAAPAGEGDPAPTRLNAGEIDRLLAESWTAAKLTASAPCSDGDFIRRATLDLTGTVPALEETEAFLADPNPDKRAVLVDRLLASEEFTDYWTAVLEKTFIGRQNRNQRFDRGTFREFLREAIGQKKPWDQIVRSMLLATGDTAEVGATGYLLRYEGKPADVAGAVAKNLLGVQIQCAQCHNHPYEKWTTADFLDFSAFFGQTRMVPVQGPDPRNPKEMKRISWEVQDIGKDGPLRGYGNKGDDKGRPMRAKAMKKQMEKAAEKNPELKERLEAFMATPRALGTTTAYPLQTEQTRREGIAEWMTSPNNPWFDKSIANRLWAQVFGRGIVHPVDDLSPKNPPSHPALLDRLAAEFRTGGRDLRGFLRLLVTTKGYALSSAASVDNEGDTTGFSRANVRGLGAEQIFGSVFQATEMQKGVPGLAMRRQFLERARERVLAGFILAFDNDEGDDAETFEGSIPQALMMLNSALTNATGDGVFTGGLSPRPGTTLGRILSGAGDAKAKIERIYLAALVRKPTAAESARCATYLAESGGGIVAFQDIFWALLNSTEFIVTR